MPHEDHVVQLFLQASHIELSHAEVEFQVGSMQEKLQILKTPMHQTCLMPNLKQNDQKTRAQKIHPRVKQGVRGWQGTRTTLGHQQTVTRGQLGARLVLAQDY
jgi:hypothetical protein